ncbi:MAG: ribosome biosis GTPase / thiamine phosphate phosphatase [Chloroflexota bacterium]|jgi:ribosome biogenesis GTPase|nr:ribosome biosis GTPase / thiamine phosphate phosphatase [Chloroflexota bacterium]
MMQPSDPEEHVPAEAAEATVPIDLSTYGWTDGREAAFAAQAEEGLVPGRVLAQDRGVLHAVTAAGMVDVTIQNSFHRTAATSVDYPAVGDWVALERLDDGAVHTLRALLPRSSAFSRGRDDGRGQIEEQILAANVDTAFLVAALTGDFNVRRLERYLALAWSSGAQPAIVLNKADLCEDVDARMAEVYAVSGDAPVHAISARRGDGLPILNRYLTPGATVVLLGSSGAGKSTLTNALMGTDVQLVRDVREDDDRGRHTTTSRHLFVLPSGALLIDTPGLRSVGLWADDGALNATFADVDALAAQCRFSDCGHESEPGCAVRAALLDGTLAPERLASQRKLEREIASIERRASPAANRAAGRAFHKLVKQSTRAAQWKNGAVD